MPYPLEECEQKIKTEIQKLISKYDCDVKLEIPPEGMGDFAFPCFSLAPILKKSPQIIANEISSQLKENSYITKIKAQLGYVNFYIDNNYLLNETLNLVLEMKDNYGNLPKKGKKTIIEHTSANPNGPLHVGRARNPIIGDTLVRIFRAAGYDVESQFYLDDMGKQVAILAWGINNLDPDKISKTNYDKPDHKSVGFYQTANKLMEEDDKIKTEIGEIIKQLEYGENKTIDLIHNAYESVLKGINESLNRINIHIDSYIPESNFVKDKSVEFVVDELKKSNYCNQEDNAFYLEMESFGIKGRNTKFFFLRKDGTTLYATRDIAYHQWKAKHANLLINILGEDHKLESKQVEIALKLLNENVLPNVLFYAFVSLPEGKMSTRKARVVYLDDLIEECISRAYLEVKKRRGDELSDEKMKAISEIVGIGSLRYNIIKVQPEKGIVFKWEEALNFEGNAVPFIQYAHARACSMLSKVKDNKRRFDAALLRDPSEISLIKHLAKLPLVIKDASTGYKPHIVANYVYEIAAKFNQFYRDCPVLSESEKKLSDSRICLVDATRIVLKNSLNILGINAPEEM